MLITTTSRMLGESHRDIIKDKIEGACELKFAIAFVKKSGISLFRDEIIECIRKRNGGAKLICSFSFGITDPSAIKELKEIGVEIKLHSPDQGIFHPKLWLFRSNNTWACLIGSANFSYAALNNNVEIGVLLENDSASEMIEQAERVFDYLWSHTNSQDASEEVLNLWESQNRKRVQLMQKIAQSMNSPTVTDSNENYGLIESFVKNWIDNWVDNALASGGNRIREKIHRGWYVIPVHGRIDDDLISRLSLICAIIKEKSGGTIDVSKTSSDPAGAARGRPQGADGTIDVSTTSSNPVLEGILDITSAKHTRPNRKTPRRALFIKQEKNYLIHLNFAYHPFRESGARDTDTLILTDYGHKLAEAKNSLERKSVYTAAMQEYQFHGLNLLEFTHITLAELGVIEFNEYSYFISHIFSMKDITLAISMVRIYRDLPDKMRADFDSMYNEYFSERLGSRANKVRGNYDSHVRQTMSVLGWCSGLLYDESKRTLSIDSSVNSDS